MSKLSPTRIGLAVVAGGAVALGLAAAGGAFAGRPAAAPTAHPSQQAEVGRGASAEPSRAAAAREDDDKGPEAREHEARDHEAGRRDDD